MSVSKREAGNAVQLSTDHQESIWNERPGRKEIPFTAWQQVHTQSSPDVEVSVPASVDRVVSAGCPQQSWAARTAPAASIPLATTIRRIIPLFRRYRRVMAEGLSQMSLKKVNNA